MYFKPVTSKYVFKSDDLTRSFPPYMQTPVSSWIYEVLRDAGIWSGHDYRAISEEFLNRLDLLFREGVPFPRDHRNFLPFVMSDNDRIINLIALCLQNYATAQQADAMESILATGGSAYAVMFNGKKPEWYERGRADIIERVPAIVKDSAEPVLSTNHLLQEAWHSCYSRNPDYEKTVSKAVDALETLFKSKYFPADKKPSLGKFVKDFQSDPSKLSFLGDTLVSPKSDLTDLAKEFIPIRGHHTSGTGRKPTKDEAVFVLHYAIFVHQIHG